MQMKKPTTKKQWEELARWWDENKAMLGYSQLVLASNLGISYGYLSAFMSYARRGWPEEYRNSWGWLEKAKKQPEPVAQVVEKPCPAFPRRFRVKPPQDRLWRPGQKYTQNEWRIIAEIDKQLREEFPPDSYRGRYPFYGKGVPTPRQVLADSLGVPRSSMHNAISHALNPARARRQARKRLMRRWREKQKQVQVASSN